VFRDDLEQDSGMKVNTGVGKSFVACALAQKACRDGYSALYTRAQALFRDLAMARADGRQPAPSTGAA
jgi:DNA replication protein DnaC